MHGGWNSDDNQNNNLGRFRFAVTRADDAAADPLPAAVREVLAMPAAERTRRADGARSSATGGRRSPEWQGGQRRIEALWQQHPAGHDAAGAARAATSRGRRIARRAATSSSRAKPVTPGVPGVPASARRPTQRRPGSTSPAGWSTDDRRRRRGRSSTASGRRTSARAWSRRSEDLGTQGEPPIASRTARLAGRRVHGRHGWSLEAPAPADRRRRRRTGSRRSVTPELLARDPDNRLLARGPRFRVDGEVVRDIALAASGLLEPKRRRAERLSAGAGVPVPAAGQLRAEDLGRSDTGPDRYRRGLYTFRFRSVPYPVLQTFDAPNGDFACVRRVAVEHAAAGAHDAQRTAVPRVCPGLGDEDARRRRRDRRRAAGLRVPPLPGARRRTTQESAALLATS